ncbi:MAG: Cna B-type domain-containing protein [Coriobacteriia bacterium]|nr:Cna B-type domain-containing protein [Coriobacteriia bacterium]MCL2137129.1 Cna B-type domain-containing protein [Coriobacteriia bacterium]
MLVMLLVSCSMLINMPLATADPASEMPSSQASSQAGNGIDAPTREQASILNIQQAETNYLGGMALDSSGKVWTWGYNAYGQLGTGKATGDYAGGMMRVPYFVDNDINIIDIEAGYHTSFAVDDQGVVYAWGNGTQGQMGNGTVTATNKSPVVVSSLAGKRILRVVCGTEWECAVFAIDDQDNVYAWGSGLYNRIPDIKTSINRTAALVGCLSSIDIVDIAVGDRHGLALDSSGAVYSWGTNTNGQLGQGNTANLTTIKKISSLQNLTVSGVSAESATSMALTDAGDAYIWGRRYVASGNTRTSYTNPANLSEAPIIYSPYGASTNLTTPQKVGFDLSSSPYNEEAPFVKSVTAGRYVNYLIDSNGRTWYMGWNVNYGFGTDGRLFTTVNGGKHSTYVSDATLLRFLGDGDTEGYRDDVKAPVFFGVASTGSFTSQFASYKNHGQWSQMADGLHPTVYDKKYMETSDDGQTTSHTYKYPLDDQGRRLVYVVNRQAGTPLRYQGNFYVALDSYAGAWIVDNRSTTALPAGVTTETSVPAVKAEERAWIGMVVDLESFDYTGASRNELPFMTRIDTYQSATLFIDNSGNLYRTSLDGSGSIAWGWDYSVYEQKTAGNNAARGLYNFYNYEVMFMRGAPSTRPIQVSLGNPQEKAYLVEDANANMPTSDICVQVEVPAALNSAQQNINVDPLLGELKYVFIPFDKNDTNFTSDTLTEAEFRAAYVNAAYSSGDLLDAQTAYTAGSYGFTVNVGDNGKLWVLALDQAYDRNQYLVLSLQVDCFYTPLLIKHTGLGVIESYQMELYAPTADNVTKTAKTYTPSYTDTSPVYGTPLDAQGQVIVDPYFGYDTVSVTKYQTLPDGLDAYWAFQTTPQQDETVVFTLDSLGFIVLDGSGAQVPYVHTYYYDSIAMPDIGIVTVWIEWLGVPPSAVPASVSLSLYIDGVPSSQTQTVTAATNWQASFTGLSLDHAYSVVQSGATGFVVAYSPPVYLSLSNSSGTIYITNLRSTD